MKKQRFTVVPSVYVLFRNGNKVLVLKRHNTGYRDGEYSLPAGHLEGGEPSVVAAVREVKEEVGVEVEPKDLSLLHTLHRTAVESDYERIDLFFEAKEWRGDFINAEPEKCSELLWADQSALPENLVPEVRQFFDCLVTGQVYSHMGF